MTLGEFRSITGGMPDDTGLVIMNTDDGDTHAIDDVTFNRYVPVIYIESSF